MGSLSVVGIALVDLFDQAMFDTSLQTSKTDKDLSS
jgi:hypothetical protein